MFAGFTVPPTKQFDLGNGSDLLYFENFLERKEASGYLESLNNELPWIRPTLSVYGQKCEQPRETCYVADEGLPTYKYSGYQPIVYKWEDFPVLKIIANAVHSALPAAKFNSVLLNRYTNGNDYAAWHADDEKVHRVLLTCLKLILHANHKVQRGSYTQRDWEHSVPKRKRVNGLRINLTFRYITSEQR
ncbi:hypothetical protein GOP47_0019506 [Adiantum capillus-veneris]|uniref:Fe2OG dioxygenase domain-containing protein n=1 Tax=Adiantum capillus-veneris TaxID=13818 RepID=A0A9D4Z9P1_ADICA|nr:hypothetical protein GOP47_0019506 [Adiantum capillus-veneris]